MMTIVIVPLVALTFDLKNRCNMSNITYTTWKGSLSFTSILDHKNSLNIIPNKLGADNTDENADILFLAVEHCTDLSLLAFLDVKHKKNEIARIVLDEAHLCITWGSFRTEFNNLAQFRRYASVPWTLLSATVPVYLEQELSKMFGNINVIRKSCNRPNLSYTCHFEKDINLAVLNLLKSKCIMQKHATIIYVRYIDQVDELVKKINEFSDTIQAVGYHAKMNQMQKENSQMAFMNDKAPIVVATSSFGMGIDKSNVRFVIQAGASYSGPEAIQMGGRAGRDGQKAYYITFTNQRDLDKLGSYRPSNDNSLQFSIAQDQLKRYLNVLKVCIYI